MQIDKNTNSQARERLSLLFDDGIYSEINSMVKEKDALTGVISAYGYVNGNAVYAFSQDKSLNSGAVHRLTKSQNFMNLRQKQVLLLLGFMIQTVLLWTVRLRLLLLTEKCLVRLP